MSIFSKINFGLSKTRNKMSGAIDDMLDAFDSFEEDLYTELEEILVMGDVGVNTAVQVVEELKSRVKAERIKKPKDVKKELENIIADLLYGGEDMGLITIPSVILMIVEKPVVTISSKKEMVSLPSLSISSTEIAAVIGLTLKSIPT